MFGCFGLSGSQVCIWSFGGRFLPKMPKGPYERAMIPGVVRTQKNRLVHECLDGHRPSPSGAVRNCGCSGRPPASWTALPSSGARGGRAAAGSGGRAVSLLRRGDGRSSDGIAAEGTRLFADRPIGLVGIGTENTLASQRAGKKMV